MEPPRNAAVRRFRWVIRLSLVLKLVAIFVLLAIVLALVGAR